MRRGGFTLIELTIGLAVAAVLFSAVVLSINSLTGAKAKGAAGELGGVIRSLYDTAALKGRTCRLVFELPGKNDKEPARYRAECAEGAVTRSKDVKRELEAANKAREDQPKGKKPRSGSLRLSDQPSLQDLLEVEQQRVERAAQFSDYTAEAIEPRELPSGVELSVWTRHQKDPVKQGTAYLYFFPQGFTEKAMVFVQQGNNVWTLSISPLTGKTSVVSEALEVPRS